MSDGSTWLGVAGHGLLAAITTVGFTVAVYFGGLSGSALAASTIVYVVANGAHAISVAMNSSGLAVAAAGSPRSA
jgi:hypothetical protein